MDNAMKLMNSEHTSSFHTNYNYMYYITGHLDISDSIGLFVQMILN